MDQERQIVKEIILEKSRYFKYFKDGTLEELVRCMRKITYPARGTIMQPSQASNYVYVLMQGKVKIMVELKYPAIAKTRFVYGEHEILHKKAKPSKVTAETECTLWVLNRKEFKACMRRCNVGNRDYPRLFKSVPLFSKLPKETLKKLEESIEVEFHATEQIIPVKSDKIYVISNGHVQVTEDKPTTVEEKIIRVLGHGDHFSVDDRGYFSTFFPGVELITLDKKFLSEIEKVEETEEEAGCCCSNAISDDEEFSNVPLNSLATIATIGTGCFGKVELMKYLNDTTKTFALKKISKAHAIRRNQQDHIITERTIHLELNHPFITRCYRTFRCDRYVYFLTEPCLGGDLIRPMNMNGRFKEDESQFVIGCVIEAFGYLHNKHIMYRDLKPENLVLDQSGYIKLTDLGLSKRTPFTGRTFTFCGTEQYFPPEVVLGAGHDKGVDFWALGVFLYELLSGKIPFEFLDDDTQEMYDGILAGIDKIRFSHFIPNRAEDLIKKLCRKEPTERIGYNNVDDIRQHRWYKGFNWEGLRSRTMSPPSIFVPSLTDSSDVSNFEVQNSEEGSLPAEETSNWDLDF